MKAADVTVAAALIDMRKRLLQAGEIEELRAIVFTKAVGHFGLPVTAPDGCESVVLHGIAAMIDEINSLLTAMGVEP